MKTKDGVEVRPGQVWLDLDKRMGERYCKVVFVVGDGIEAVAVMQKCRYNGTELTQRTTRVKIRRMHKHSTGWALVR